jgi:hypothetical protein
MKHTSTYTLTRDKTGQPVCTVEHHGQTYPLTPEASQKLYNHSPDGFEWGYAGSGPSQLALAILVDYLAQRDFVPSLALAMYQEFKSSFLVPTPKAGRVITSNEIENFIYHETHQ